MRRLRIGVGLRTEIVASVSVLMILAIVLVSALIIQAVHVVLFQLQLEASQRMMNALQVGLAMAIQGKGEEISEVVRPDVQELQALLTGATEGDHGGLVLAERNGRILWASPSPQNGGQQAQRDLKDCMQTGQEVMRILGGEGMWPSGGGRVLAHTVPLFSAQGRVWGALRMEVPLKGAQEALLRSSWVLPAYLVVVMAVLILFGSYMISRNVLQPLRRLIGASERIAHGDHEIDWKGYPPHEVGRLAEALQRMAQSLQEHEEAQRRQLEDLERSNRALVQAHQALVRSEKLASVGRVAAGVVHEIGNPIGSILGFVEILLRDAQGQAERDSLMRIRSEAERIRRTLRTLLDLAKPSGRRWERVKLASLVEETLALSGGHQGMKGVQVQWSPPRESCVIWADRDQIRQVLLNLILNALDALGGQGQLWVRAGSVPELPEEGDLVPPPRRKGEPSDADFTGMRRTPPPVLVPYPGPYVFLEVEDTGPGIPAEDLPHLFEPFFTTKDPGRGTGLGLAVCLGIVESYGGRIQVKTRPGEGTRFTIYLPVGDAGSGRGWGAVESV